MHKSHGFTLAELLITIAIAAIVGALVATSYRSYQIRSNLDVAATQTTQALQRTQLRAQSGEEVAAWGYDVESGTIFLGTDYATRDAAFDETVPLPSGITVSGITEVYYTPLYGVPSIAGDIILTTSNGDERRITISTGTYAGPPIPPVRFRVLFDRIQNSGNGSAQPTMHVGIESTEYQEGAWVDLTNNGKAIIDNGINLLVPGLAVQRDDGFVRIVAYGGMQSGGKEVVDARIEFDRGIIDHLENEEGDNVGENPFDGNVNNGVGGDEYTLAPDQKSALFQTRVTNAGDTILLFWQPSNP